MNKINNLKNRKNITIIGYRDRCFGWKISCYKIQGKFNGKLERFLDCFG
jgi:hypothetical protein